MWLPVTPKPTTIEVGAKAQGARGIGEELERVCFSLIRLYKNGNTIPGRKKTVPPHDVSSCQSIKTDVVVELPDSGGQVNQVAEEELHCWCHLGNPSWWPCAWITKTCQLFQLVRGPGKGAVLMCRALCPGRLEMCWVPSASQRPLGCPTGHTPAAPCTWPPDRCLCQEGQLGGSHPGSVAAGPHSC